MTTLREAAQQALEALNSIDVGYRSPSGDPLEVSFDEVKCEAAIAALRAALAQQDEPVQEPVAWYQKRGQEVLTSHPACWGREDEPWTPLYTAPPRCPNCASLEAQNTELDRRLAEMEQAYENGYKAGVAAEREECAKVCEAIDEGIRDHEDVAACAKAIRARRST